jgi:hypothetical protein
VAPEPPERRDDLVGDRQAPDFTVVMQLPSTGSEAGCGARAKSLDTSHASTA